MTVAKLAVDICFGKKRWPEPEEWTSLVHDELGLTHVEFDSDFLDPFFVSEPARSEIAARTRELAAERGLAIHNYYTGTITHCVNLLSHPDERVRADGLRWCRAAIALAARLGARGLGGHFDTICSRDCADPGRYQQRVDGLVESMQELSRTARQNGSEFLLLEQMYAPSEAPYTFEQTRTLFEAINRDAAVPVQPTLDVGHACCQNFEHSPEDRDPYAWIRAFGGAAPVIHIHQTTADGSCHWPFTAEYNARGIIHPEPLLRAVEDSGADQVLLVMEVFMPLGCTDEQVIAAMRESVEYWRPYVCLDED
jgi:sugar phosphate isomerase/epimerase